ncbi:MAG: PAS domain S-box protein [Candidatus Sumerlaeia bacterium]|nr:PAS domain S-box protein [Candidatus Sumerlaeia bacterium]
MASASEKYRVLIADDEPDFAESVRMLLESAGYDCHLAADGEATLRLLQDEPFDVVLIDYRMPGNQNFECLHWVARRFPEMPILLVTGFPSLPSAVESLKLRVFDYVTKPFDPNYLRRRVGEAAEWKRLRAALRESESHFRDLFEGIPDAVLVHETDGRILDINEAACALLGYGRAELMRMNMIRLIAHESEIEWRRLTAPQPGCPPAPFEVLFRTRNGTTVPCEVTQRSVLRAGKSVIQSVARDITARRKAEEELHWRNRRLAAYYTIARTLNESLDFQYLVSRSLEETLHVMDVSSGALFLLEDEQLVTGARRGLDEAFTRSVESGFRRDAPPFRRVLAEGRVHTVSDLSSLAIPPQPSGSSQPIVSLLLVPIHSRGVPLGLLLIACDRPSHFTEAEIEMLEVIGSQIGVALENGRLYAQVMDSERRYRQLFDEIGDPVLFHDFSGSIQAVNQAACSLLGFSEEELLYEGLDKIGGWQYVQQVGARMKNADDQGRLPLFESVLRTRDKRPVEIEVHARIMSGARAGVLSVLRDVTARNLEARRALLIGTVRGALARHRSITDYAGDVVQAVRVFVGCDSVGLRLADSDGRLPFIASVGFPESFIAAENARPASEEPCICGALLEGETAAGALPLTAGGSFVCNDVAGEANRATPVAPYVGRSCLAPPVGALALLPIRHGDRFMGFLHAADRRKDVFSPPVIVALEEVAGLVAAAVHQYELETSLAWEVRLTEIGFGLTGGLLAGTPLEEAVQTVLRQIMDLTGFEILSVERAVSDTGQMETWIALGTDTTGPPLSSLTASRGLEAEDLNLGEKTEPLPFPLKWREIRYLLTFPIRSKKTTVAVLCAAAARPIASRPHITKFLAAIADQLAVALSWAEAHDQLDRSRRELHSLSGQLIRSLEDERARIARELHDSLGQILTAIQIDLDRQMARHTPAATKATEVLARLHTQIHEAQTTVRHLTASLRPGILDDLGLAPALESCLDEFQERTGITVRLTNPFGVVMPISSECSVALYRVVQEALTNVARHAGARAVEITLARENEAHIALMIRDDGRGFDPASLNWQTSFGLLGMRERLQLVGGSLHIASQPGQGTTIRASVPVRRES